MSRTVQGARWGLFWTIALAGTAFDLATKKLIFAFVGPPHSRPVSLVPQILELQTSYNTGALWGMGRTLPYSSQLFGALSVAAAFFICYFLFVKGASADRRLTVALGLIMAGAMGNCYDRLFLGHVRDFAHFHVDRIHFDCAIFNFADNMLVIGALILMLLALRPEATDPPPSNASSELPSPSTGPIHSA